MGGMKMKAMARNPCKPHQDEEAKCTQPCNHYTKGNIELNRILSRIQSSSKKRLRCQECRKEAKRRSKRKGKTQKRKGEAILMSNFIWVCLDCNLHFCGGVKSDSEPYGHSRRHAKINHHPWAVLFDNPQSAWCFSCNSLVPIKEKEGENVEMKLAMDVEERGKAMEKEVKNLVSESKKGYIVRGLTNLGNTCFLNSVLQNLFAIDKLRDYFAILEQPVGPLTVNLQHLFVETSVVDESVGELNPIALFGSICDKASQFIGDQQQDSHELLRYLLDGLHSEGTSNGQDKGSPSSGSSFVDVIFGGELSSTVSCVVCGHTSTAYERFLDLSLPVPSKKPPSKRVRVSNPKKNKLPMREGDSDSDKAIAKGSPVAELVEKQCSSSPFECNESYFPSLEEKQVTDDQIVLGIVDGSDSQKFEVPIAQSYENWQVFQSENFMQCSSGSETDMYSVEPVVGSDSCGEGSCRDEGVSSCFQDSGKEMDNVAFTGSPVKESSEKTTTIVVQEQVEVDFADHADGLNEPVIASDPKAETGVGEEIDATLQTGNNSSESNQVDDTSAPLSVDSCLALFVKTELLSGEHAWHCEHCSENLPHKNAEHRKRKRQSEAFDFQVDGGESRSKKVLRRLDASFVDSTGSKSFGDRKMVPTSDNLVSHMEGLDDPNENVGVSQKPLGNKKSLEPSDPKFRDQDHCPDALQKDEEIAVSDHTSQHQSCPSVHEASNLQENLGKLDNDSHSINDLKSVGYDERNLAAVSGTSQDHKETNLPSTCENDFSEANQLEKRGSQVLGKVHPTDDSKSEGMETKSGKVNRDASKRILINRAPLILTIHLKRFSQDAHGHLEKLGGHINFQEILDLRPYMDPSNCGEKEKSCYRLIGVVEHSGSMTRGHYVAYVRGERSRGIKTEKAGSPSWFYASDSYVREASLSEVLQCEAYILFYERI